MDNMGNVETGDNEDYLDNVESIGQLQRQPMRQPKIQLKRQPKRQPDFQNISRCVKTRQFKKRKRLCIALQDLSRHVQDTVVRRNEIHMFDEQLEQLVAKWNFTWVYFTLDGLSVYTAAGESLNVGVKLTSYMAEVRIRKIRLLTGW